MLVIRREQEIAFQPELEQSFVERLVEWAGRKHHPELPYGDLERRVQDAYRRARGYGLGSRTTVAQFVDLDMRLGAGFELAPDNAWMKVILANTDLTGPTRLYRIECRLERLAAVAAALENEEG